MYLIYAVCKSLLLSPVAVKELTQMCYCNEIKEERSLSLSSMHTKADSFANSVDPDKTARHEPSHQDQHSLPI